jgi:hypothetical protein
MARTPISRNPSQRAKKGEPPSLNWARWVEDSIRRLVDLSDQVQTPVYGGGGSFVHPFKLIVTTSGANTVLRVRYGDIKAGHIVTDSASNDIPSFRKVQTTINTGDLVDDPIAPGTVGEITLAASTTYGVWIEVDFEDPGTNYRNPYGGVSYQWVNWIPMQFSTTARIVVDSTLTDEDDAAAKTAANSDKGYYYVGKVALDADELATITQHLKSDLTLPVFGFPFQILSDDANQSLTTGADGGIFYDEP